MAQSLELNIKTTSDVPQAMDKAKAATVSFGKQVEDIQKKFSTAFKDAVFTFAAPLVIINKIMGDIEASMQRSREISRKGFEEIASGENKLADARETRMARFIKAQQDQQDYQEQTAAGKAESAARFVDKNQMDFLLNKPVSFFAALMGELNFGKGFGYNFVQQAALERFEAKNPVDSRAQAASAASAAAVEAAKAKPTTFKGPEGFSNVVGVGANPVMEAMNAQLEEQRKQTALLERMANAGFSSADGWMTAPASVAAPSRAALLRGKQ
jgi:hypothetical protein